MADVTVYDDFLVKGGVTEHEAAMQRRAAKLLPAHVPHVLRYEKARLRMKMSLVSGCTLAYMYGNDCRAIPAWVWGEVRRLVRTLYEGGVVYPDITSYNFMIDADEKIWIIDFEHCTTREPGPFAAGGAPAPGEQWFVREFLSGDSGDVWNEDFA
jgi:tRNA A-37 threonylcarbamoyl transferase component Bud32